MSSLGSLKIDVKKVIYSRNSEDLLDSSLFVYGNGSINWFATDFLMSSFIPEGSKNTVKGQLRYFLEYLENYSQWQGCTNDWDPVPLGEVTDDHLFDFVNYIEEDLGIGFRNRIHVRLRTALKFMNFIQQTYSLDHCLMSVSPLDGKSVEYGSINAEWRVNSHGRKYLYHESLPNFEEYPSRNPITEEAIESIYNDLLEMYINEPSDEYKYQLLSVLTAVLEKTGVRVSEAVLINTYAIELLRTQLNAKSQSISIEQLIKTNNLRENVEDLKAAKAIYEKSKINKDKTKVIWLAIKTTKGAKKGKIRLVPITINTAELMVKFYDDYILEEFDRADAGLTQVNRKQYNKLFIHPSSHLPMTGRMVSSMFYDVFTRKYKSKHKRTPHLFRHRFISILVAKEAKRFNQSSGNEHIAKLIMKKIQGLTGHASLDTMIHYVDLAFLEEYGEQDVDIFEPDVRKLLLADHGEEYVAELESKIRANRF